MKTWKILILVVLLVSLPVFSACDLLGLGGDDEDEYYRKQLEAYRQQQEAYKKQQEEYYKKLEEGLNKYMEEYQKYQNKVTEQQLPGEHRHQHGISLPHLVRELVTGNSWHAQIDQSCIEQSRGEHLKCFPPIAHYVYLVVFAQHA